MGGLVVSPPIPGNCPGPCGGFGNVYVGTYDQELAARDVCGGTGWVSADPDDEEAPTDDR